MNAETRERIWRAVRAGQPGFSTEDLAQASGCPLEDAEAYCAWLESAGYIRPHGQGRFRATQAARGSLAAPSPDGQERITLELVLDTACRTGSVTGGLRLLRESTPGAWQRVQKALAQPGSLRGTESDTARDRMWAGVRELRRFTRKELAAATGCAKGAVADYVRLLCLSGLAAETGRTGQEAIYELTSDPGPERPVIRETIRRKRRKTA